MSSGRFAIATHALVLLANREEASSEVIAKSVCTNPVIVRRLMGSLVAAGLVSAHEGRGGGYRLARAASKISLRDVYEAIEPEGPVAPSACEPSDRCAIGAGMREAFEEVSRRARRGLAATLAEITIAHTLERALALGTHTKGHEEKSEKQDGRQSSVCR